VAWTIPLDDLRQLSPPASRPPSAYSLWGQGEKQRWPSCCTNTLQQQLKHWCVIGIVLVTNLKHSTIWAAMKKVNSIPARPSAIYSASNQLQWSYSFCVLSGFSAACSALLGLRNFWSHLWSRGECSCFVLANAGRLTPGRAPGS